MWVGSSGLGGGEMSSRLWAGMRLGKFGREKIDGGERRIIQGSYYLGKKIEFLVSINS